MCGIQLNVPAAATAPANYASRQEARKRAPTDEGIISGPSFLGLNAPAKERASYLLEDEPPRRWRNYVLLLILVVVGGLIWMQWRNSLKAQIARISAMATQPSQPPAPPSSAEPDVSATDKAHTTAGADQQQKPKAEAPPEPPAPAEAGAQPGADQQSRSGKDSKSPRAGTEGAAPGAQTGVEKEPAAEPKPDLRSEEADSAAQGETSGAGGDSTSTHARSAPLAEDDSMLVLAQKYLHGRGVQQNCEQGLIYLRRAVQHSSAKARSQLGALYATGHCVPEDRVEAYRWFTSALDLDPNNVWLERQRDTLFAQMTNQERQRAR
jgi:hypothetical protein